MVFHGVSTQKLGIPDLPDLPDLDLWPHRTVHLLKEVGGTVVDGIAVTSGCHPTLPRSVFDQYKIIILIMLSVVEIDCDCH